MTQNKIRRKIDFLALLSKINLWLHPKKKIEKKNLSLLDFDLEEEDLVKWMSLLEREGE